MKQRFGRIINLTSVVAQIGNTGQAAYSAAKAGIIGFTKTMAKELASRSITVNAVAPGFIETDMTRSLPEEAKTGYLSHIPAGRWGTVDEVADTVAFLANPRAGAISLDRLLTSMAACICNWSWFGQFPRDRRAKGERRSQLWQKLRPRHASRKLSVSNWV